MFDEMNKTLLDALYEWDSEDERFNGEILAVKLQDENQMLDPLSRHVLSTACLCRCETLSGTSSEYNRKRRAINDDDEESTCRVSHLYQHCERIARYGTSIEASINEDQTTMRPSSVPTEEPAHQLFRDAWNFYPRESEEFQRALDASRNTWPFNDPDIMEVLNF